MQTYDNQRQFEEEKAFNHLFSVLIRDKMQNKTINEFLDMPCYGVANKTSF